MRKILALVLVTVMAVALFASCGQTSTGGSVDYALVTKSAGNAYNEKEAEGFEAAMKAQGITSYIIKHPEKATVDAQIATINSLIAQGVK